MSPIIKIKAITAKFEDDDGVRTLISYEKLSNYKKQKYKTDKNYSKLTPSKTLFNNFHTEKISSFIFEREYATELENHRDLLITLVDIYKHNNISLLYINKNEEKFLKILKGIIEKGPKVQLLNKYIKIASGKIKDPCECNQTGVELLNKGFLEYAINAFEVALNLAPNEDLDTKFSAYNNLGNAYSVIKGGGNDAIEMYKKAIDIKPELPELYCNLSMEYINQKRYDEALENIEKIRKWTRRKPILYYRMGLIYIDSNENKEGLKLLNKADSIN